MVPPARPRRVLPQSMKLRLLALQSLTPRTPREERVWMGFPGRGFLEAKCYCLWAQEHKPKIIVRHPKIADGGAEEVKEMMQSSSAFYMKST